MNYAIPSSFLNELPRDEVEFIDPALGRNYARTAADEWRSKVGPAARDWADTGARPYLPPAKATELRPTIPDTPQTGLTIGVLVQHEEYGLGTVTDLSGYGAETRQDPLRHPGRKDLHRRQGEAQSGGTEEVTPGTAAALSVERGRLGRE